MSQITLTFAHRVDGTLTNVTSAVLSDPTGTFGVKRDDTDAVVVADATAMTNDSTGFYTYTFTEPSGGNLTYTYYVEWVYGGVTNRAEFSATGATPEPVDEGSGSTTTIRYRTPVGFTAASVTLTRIVRDDTETDVTLPDDVEFAYDADEDVWTVEADLSPGIEYDWYALVVKVGGDETYAEGTVEGEGEESTVGYIATGGGTIVIRKGDSYGTTSGQQLTITQPNNREWPSNLASLPWVVTFTATKIDKSDGTASSTIGPITCSLNSSTSVNVPLTATQTGVTLHRRHTDDVNGWEWDLQASTGSLRVTLASGTMTVLPEVTTG